MNPLKKKRYDVVVVGGGAAGTAAAIGAAKAGAHTLLVERYGFLGGAATHSQVLAYCGFYSQARAAVQHVAGVGDDVLREMNLLGVDTTPVYSRTGNWIVVLDAEATKLAFDRLLEFNQVALRLHSRLIDVRRSGDALASIIVSDHDGMHEIEATCFVDASGEASLSTFAGVDLRVATTDARSLQPASLPVRIGGIAKHAAIDRVLLMQLVRQYNLDAAEPILREDGGVILSLPLSGDIWWMTVDLNTGGLCGEDLGRAETAARRLAWTYLDVLRQHPGFEGAYIVSTGPQLGIRETRHPQSQCDVNVRNATDGSRSADGIGRACWPMEVHESPGRVRYSPIGGAGFFDIPHQALLPKGVANLRLAGRTIGSDRDAYGSIRVMGTAFATGQAAGVSAALSASTRTLVSSDVLRKTLCEQHAIV
jgi:hypothetical protein